MMIQKRRKTSTSNKMTLTKKDIMDARGDVVELWLAGRIDDENFRVFMSLIREVTKEKEVSIQ